MISAVESPTICAPLRRPSISPEFLKFVAAGGYSLADKHEGGKIRIDVLLGLDCYWQLMDGALVRFPQGPVLFGSVFGHMLSGSHLYPSQSACPAPNVSFQLLNLADILESFVKPFFDLEFVGFKGDECEKEPGSLALK